MDSDLSSIVWGKWLALGCLTASVIIIIISIRFYSIRRMRQGHGAIPGTRWMALPIYSATETDREGLPEVAAPPYNPEVGELDAGVYDKNGNFIARPQDDNELHPPRSAARADNSHQRDVIILQELPQMQASLSPSEHSPPPPEYNTSEIAPTERSREEQTAHGDQDPRDSHLSTSAAHG